VIANQLRALQATVAEVVGAQNPERVLSAITERAAFAVNAHAFLLVVRISADEDDQAYGFGLSDAEKARLAASGRPSRPDAGTLVVDIVSPSRRYGYLVAYSHDDFLDEERQFLDAYAGLAAVALDAMSALDAAAERQQTAERLLTLAQSLTHARSVSEVASVTTDTVRAVVHADVATMLLLDDEGRLSVVAHSGFPPSDRAAVEALVIAPQHAPHLFEARRARPDTATRYDQTTGDPLMASILGDLGLHHMTVVGIALPDHLYGVLVAGSRMERGTGQHAQVAARMSGVAKQAATVLRSRELLDQTWRLAHIDELTGLANRRAFMSELDAAVAAGPGALLFLDLDGFKQVNDTLGHASGDELLAAVADRLANCARSEDTVARLGGDEFVVLLRGMTEPAILEERASAVREAFAHPLALSSIVTTVGASIGVTRYVCGELTEEVLRRADAAMYEAKRAHQLATGNRPERPALGRVS
jgi:diguanylate cyclase (GGDEF)-like protein